MRLKDIQGIIWDLDGTLYRFDELFKDACNRAAAQAASTILARYTYEEAYVRTVQSEIDHGFSLRWFHDETGLPFEDMHFLYHDSVDEKVIARNDEMADALRALHLPSVILTNASRGWVTRILKHLGMDDLFDENLILALEDADFVPKGRGTTGFERALSILNIDPANVLMVEDLPKNLEVAKSTGMKTALVHHGQLTEKPAHVDYLYANTLDLVRDLTAVIAA